jgi:hypothetical protein
MLVQMLKALMLGKSSMFGDRHWTDLPWNGCNKPIEQRLYDYGFSLASLIEDSDDLVTLDAAESNIVDETITLLERCDNLQTGLELLYATSSLKAFLQNRSDKWTRSTFEKSPSPALSISDRNRLSLIVNLWAFELLIGWIAAELKERLISALELRQISLQTQTARARRLCAVFAVLVDTATLTDLALAILQYLPLCMEDRTSNFAASRALLPITCVVWQLRHNKKNFPTALELMKRIDRTRKIRFATEHSVMSLVPAIVRDDGGLVTANADEINQIGWLFDA